MKTSLFYFWLLIMVLVPSAQEPEHRDDKWKDDPHARCMRPEVVEHYGPTDPSLHACSCHQSCAVDTDEDGNVTDQHAREDSSCQMYCSAQRCGCHPDENACDAMPEVRK